MPDNSLEEKTLADTDAGANADKTETDKVEKTEAETDAHNDSTVSNPDPYYPPIIYLPEVIVNDGEDDEEEVFKMRARLYRYAHECSPPEWKERGTGDIRILQHMLDNTCRIVMRREKTLKLCANHFIHPWMELKKNCGSEKAWVWKTQADYADDECKQETLAARFSSVDNAKKWEEAFVKARKHVLERQAGKILKEEEISIKEKASPTSNTTVDKVEEAANKENKENIVDNNCSQTKSETSVVEEKSAVAAEEGIVKQLGEMVVNNTE